MFALGQTFERGGVRDLGTISTSGPAWLSEAGRGQSTLSLLKVCRGTGVRDDSRVTFHGQPAY